MRVLTRSGISSRRFMINRDVYFGILAEILFLYLVSNPMIVFDVHDCGFDA